MSRLKIVRSLRPSPVKGVVSRPLRQPPVKGVVSRPLRQPPVKGVVSRRRTGGSEKRGLSLICTPAEWQLRVQLAAAYRVADRLGWNELIYTHISARVPGPQHHFLINPYGLSFDEVTASNLVKIDVEGNKVSPSEFSANKAGFVIHSAIHMARPDAACVWHMHTLAGMAVSAQDEGLLPVHMYSHNFWNRLAYHDFEGPSMRLDERERLVESLGRHDAIILRNHGLLTVGRTIPEAFIRFWRLNRACEIQLAAQAAKLRLPPPEVCEASFRMGEEFLTDQADLGQLEFDAIVRKLDASHKN